jgi:hypothetical protein
MKFSGLGEGLHSPSAFLVKLLCRCMHVKTFKTIVYPFRLLQTPLTARMYGDEERENENKLSMSASDSNIDSVPYRILVDMFNDASQITVKKDNIIKSPGCTDTFYVADNKSRKPKEAVINFKSLNIKCEKICLDLIHILFVNIP